MISDLDIWRTANVIIDGYGDDAATEAADRADELFDEGDQEGCAVWKRIKGAAEKLLETEPEGPVN